MTQIGIRVIVSFRAPKRRQHDTPEIYLLRSCAKKTMTTKMLRLYTILEACQPPPEILNNRVKIDAKWEVRKGQGKNVEKLTL